MVNPDHRSSVLRRVLNAFLATVSWHAYRPEKYYMRGPGPRTLSRLGEVLRAQSETVTREPLPQRWLELLEMLEKQQQDDSSSRAGR